MLKDRLGAGPKEVARYIRALKNLDRSAEDAETLEKLAAVGLQLESNLLMKKHPDRGIGTKSMTLSSIALASVVVIFLVMIARASFHMLKKTFFI